MNRDEIIDHMCLTWRHDYGLVVEEPELFGSGMTVHERTTLWNQMSQLYDNCVEPHVHQLVEGAVAECIDQLISTDVPAPVAAGLNLAPLSDEPNWRHPKIQGLIGSEARLRIQVDLIWRILEDPTQEFGSSDMEYWDTLHDKLKSTLTAHRIKGD
jgi:hypothetical protein